MQPARQVTTSKANAASMTRKDRRRRPREAAAEKAGRTGLRLDGRIGGVGGARRLGGETALRRVRIERVIAVGSSVLRHAPLERADISGDFPDLIVRDLAAP